VQPPQPAIDVPLEAFKTEKFLVSPTREPSEGERREQQLVTAYAEYLARVGRQSVGACIVPPERT
jgi:hypothetical protein